MAATDPRIDAYIAKSREFAKPILKHLRALVHRACPSVQETMKWSFPHFEYKGVLCSMAAFKQHCSFGFWKAALLKSSEAPASKGQTVAKHGMGNMGKIRSLDDLPADRTILALVKQAAKLNEAGVKVPKPAKPTNKKPLRVPADFDAALKASKTAKDIFQRMSPSHKREYIEWIVEAKGADTRQRRINTAVEWIVEDKSRHWKYQKK